MLPWTSVDAPRSGSVPFEAVVVGGAVDGATWLTEATRLTRELSVGCLVVVVVGVVVVVVVTTMDKSRLKKE